MPVLKPDHPRDPEFQAALRDLAAGLLPGGRLRRPAAAERARHPRARLGQPALLVLPAWRGAAPVQHAIWAGDEVTGATTFRIVKELDAGPTFGRDDRADPRHRHRRRPAGPARRGRRRAARRHPRRHRGRRLEARPQPAEGRQLRAQDHRRGRPRRLGPSPRVARRPPDPGLHAGARRLDDVRRQRVKLGPVDAHRRAAGARASSRVGKAEVLVGTGTTAVRLGEVKAFGARQMPAADWARGLRLPSRAPVSVDEPGWRRVAWRRDRGSAQGRDARGRRRHLPGACPRSSSAPRGATDPTYKVPRQGQGFLMHRPPGADGGRPGDRASGTTTCS